MSGEKLPGSGTEGDATIRFVPVIVITDSRAIGRDGDMSWYLPEDLKQFKRAMTGHPAAISHRTYESTARQLGGPLPKRHSVVLTTRGFDLLGSAEAVESVGSAAVVAEGTADEIGIETVYIVGGVAVYEQLPGRAAGLVLTELDATHEGDTRFPEWDRRKQVETDRDDRDGFSFTTYERKQPVTTDRGAEESDE